MSAFLLIALSALTSAQKYRADPAVVAWLGDDVLLVESFVDVPDAGVRVGSLIKSGGPLEQRFVIVDRSTGALRSGLLEPERSDECPAPGAGTELTLWQGKTIELRGAAPRYWSLTRLTSRETPHCLFDVQVRTKSLVPISTVELVKRLNPTVVKLLADYAKNHRDQKLGAYVLFDLDATTFVASATDRCKVWVVKGESIDQARDKNDELCQYGALSLEWRREGELEARSIDRAGQEARASELAALAEAKSRLVRLLTESQAANVLLQQRNTRDALTQWKSMYLWHLQTNHPPVANQSWRDDTQLLAALGLKLDLSTLEAASWAEAFNNLGFALWSAGEFHQAKGAYLASAAMVTRSSTPRPVLELNFGDLERDLRNPAEARAHYTAAAGSTALTDTQRAYIAQELAKLK